MGAFDDLIPKGNEPARKTTGLFDDLIAQPKEPSLADDALEYGKSLARGTGLAARSVASAATGIPTMVGDAANTAINFGIRAKNAMVGGDTPYLDMPSRRTQELMTHAGVPEPDGTAERLIFGDIAPAVLGGGGVAKLAEKGSRYATNDVAKRVLDIMGRDQGMQAVSNVAGGTAGGVTREAGGGPMAQFIASLVGGATPGLAPAAGAATLRGIARGAETGRQRYNERLSDFQDAGVDPSVGQAAGNRRMQAADSILSRTPGGAGPMASAAEREARQMQARVDELANRIMPNADTTRAGVAIQKGLEQFTKRVRSESKFLYEKLDQRIPSDTPVGVDNTRAMLESLNADIEGAPKLSAMFKNETIQQIETALTSDVGEGGVLPWKALTKLRTLVGSEIDNHNLQSTVPRDKWRALYGALSDDMGGAVANAGPDAQRAFYRANKFYRAANDRIDSVLDRVRGSESKSPEAVFQTATQGTREGASTLIATMKSLDPEQRKMVAAATIDRLGRANPGKQNAAGDAFSSETFLTNWDKIGDDARRVLYPSAEARAGLDAVALAAQRMREGSKVFANPSGTSGGLASQAAPGAFGGALMSGHVGTAGAIAAGIATANVGARLMTNPGFVRWIGKTTKMSPAAYTSQLNLLAQQARNWSAEDQQAVAEFIGQSGR